MPGRLLLQLFLTMASLNAVYAIDASIALNRLATPTGPYLEVHSFIVGSTVTFDSTDQATQLQAQVLMTIIIQRGDSIVVGERLALNSPLVERPTDFLDFRRYRLNPGTYQVSIELEDLALTTNRRRYETEVSLDPWPEQVGLSDAFLLADVSPNAEESDPLFRHGLHMEPLAFNFYGRGANTLGVYSEVYATDVSSMDRVLIFVKIEEQSAGNIRQLAQSFQVKPAAPVIPILQQMDISELPSGNYQAVVEVRSPENELVSRREIPFQRANPLVDMRRREEELSNFDMELEFVGDLSADTLRYSLLAITPLLPQTDITTVDAITRELNEPAMKMYLFSFWAKQNPSNPAAAYNAYMEVAKAVDRTFASGFRNGFETDRGYIYMKYGEPNDITRVETDPVAPPYEIWSYDFIHLTGQNNRRFVFYNPSLAAGDFILLHSDVIGERNNPQWQVDLYRDAPADGPDDYFQGTEVKDNFGRQADRIFRDY